MRRALAERDRRCVWPGCDRRPEWAQADHAVPWRSGGETEVDGMRLLCTGHHARLSRGWRLERLPDRRMVVHPPGRSGPVFGPAVHDPPPGELRRDVA